VNFAIAVFPWVRRASELEAGFARSLGQRLHTTVVGEAGAVEGDLLDASGLGALGDALANQAGGVDIRALAGNAELFTLA
jgi:hypothetical protein